MNPLNMWDHYAPILSNRWNLFPWRFDQKVCSVFYILKTALPMPLVLQTLRNPALKLPDLIISSRRDIKVHPSASVHQISCQTVQHLLNFSLSWVLRHVHTHAHTHAHMHMHTYKHKATIKSSSLSQNKTILSPPQNYSSIYINAWYQCPLKW